MIPYVHNIRCVEIPKVKAVTLVNTFCSLFAKCVNLYAYISWCVKWDHLFVNWDQTFLFKVLCLQPNQIFRFLVIHNSYFYKWKPILVSFLLNHISKTDLFIDLFKNILVCLATLRRFECLKQLHFYIKLRAFCSEFLLAVTN